MTEARKIAISARLARVAATSAISAAVLGPLLARFGILPAMTGFMLFGLALPFSLLAIFLGIIGLFATRRSTGKAGTSSALASVVVGLLLLLIVGALGRNGSAAPPIHDISTNLEDPPQFVALADDPANKDEDLTFPHGPADTIEQHKVAYSDLTATHLLRTPAEALAMAKAVAEELGWEIVEVTEPAAIEGEAEAPMESTAATSPSESDEVGDGSDGGNGEITEPYRRPQPVQATMEATATSKNFRFVDDIVVRIRGPEGPDAAHSMVDIRSKSRDGQSDLGANAARIRAFQQRLDEAVQDS